MTTSPHTPDLDEAGLAELHAVGREFCREICAYKGEPPCWKIDADAGETWPGPCEVCEPASAYHMANRATTAGEPVAYEIVSYDSWPGNNWCAVRRADEYREKYGCVLRPLYAHPSPDSDLLREARDEIEARRDEHFACHTARGDFDTMDADEREEWERLESLRARLDAALSAAPAGGEVEAIVTINRMGWEDQEDGSRLFTATAVFARPPAWTANVVWNGVPVRMIPAGAEVER